jgi:putative endonuclease
MTNKTYWVYILASRKNGRLYVGVTNSLLSRTWQHKNKTADGFTKRYGVDRLVYYEEFRDVTNAIAREKQLKAGSRAKKIAVIERENPEWNDLSEILFGPRSSPAANSS